MITPAPPRTSYFQIRCRAVTLHNDWMIARADRSSTPRNRESSAREASIAASIVGKGPIVDWRRAAKYQFPEEAMIRRAVSVCGAPIGGRGSSVQWVDILGAPSPVLRSDARSQPRVTERAMWGSVRSADRA